MTRKIIADAAIASQISREVTPTASLLYLMILGHRNGKTGECYVTQETLSEELGKNVKTVERNLKALKESGFLDWKKGSSFSSKANSYIFLKESFDEQGIGEKIEQKKLKAKNKEERFKEKAKEPQEVSETKVIAMDDVQKKRIQRKTENASVKTELQRINALKKECIQLCKEYNELVTNNPKLFPNGIMLRNFNLEDVVKFHIKNEDYATAESVLQHEFDMTSAMLNNLRDRAIFEKRAETFTMEDAMTVYEKSKPELDESTISYIENRAMNFTNKTIIPRNIIVTCKTEIIKKGKVFDLDAMLSV